MANLTEPENLHPWAATLLDRVGMATAEIDERGFHRSVCSRYSLLTGYDRASLAALRAGDLLHAEDRAVLENAECSPEPVYKAEVRLRRRDGNTIWVRITGRREENIRQILVEDISVSKQAQLDLLAAHDRFECAVRGTSEGVWDWNILTNEDYFSDRWCELLGYSRSELQPCYQTWVDLLHPEDRPCVLESVRSHLEGWTPYDIEYRMRTKSGEFRWYRARGRAVWDANGRPVRMAGSIADIHDRKLMELRLQESLNRYNAAVATSGHVLYEWDSQADQTTWTGNLTALLGSTEPSSQLSFTEWLELIHDYDRERIRAALDQFLYERGRFCEEYRIRKEDGTYIFVEDTARFFRDGGGILNRVIGWVVDISKRKALELELRESHDRLEQRVAERTRDLQRMLGAVERANRAKSLFLATMSHEIRTPMNGILGMSEMLGATSLDRDQREYLRHIRSSLDGLLLVINDILDFSRIDEGKVEIEKSAFDLIEMVHSVLGPLTEKARSSGVDVRCEIDSAIRRQAIGDATRIRQILLKLVSNAVKFTAKGSVTTRLTLSKLDSADSLVRFEVHDTGIGIPKRVQHKLFQPFSQVDDSTTRKFGGTGLGLAICKQLAGLMGGTIGVESEPGEGSTFWFEVPMAWAAESAQPAATQEQNTSAGPAESIRGARILVAEDNPINQRVAVSLLRKQGAEVDLAANGLIALDLAMSRSYDAILMDYHMPEMDGLECTRRIRERQGDRPRIPIIALTAAAMNEDKDRCFESGMDDYLTKPVHSARLYETLSRWLPHR